MNRRELLKLSATSLFAVMASPFVSAQNNVSSAGPKGASVAPAIDGNISYNAGWVVPLEDKNPLLELEAIKTKERQEAVKQKANTAANSAPSKDKPKSISDKFQDIVGKVKNFF